ncbi:MAG: methylated-DNA--[protein]-cysteine S-methyltransferase [Candidatus Sericytochromatia bacterium]|nr:methylated-DNA--[protein]-cysteine S-methyltransferase [Candidatus Sericytochromatia bacterium]
MTPPLRLTIGDSPLGRLLVATSPAGLCAVLPGDADDCLREALRRRLPGHPWLPVPPSEEPAFAAVLALIATPAAGWAGPPLVLTGTPFQRRVWEALRAIPCGRIVTYGQLAATLGAPRATRAVAAAVGANALAVVVPCHRVGFADGGLGGFRWGLARKRALRAREAALV